MLCQDGRLVDWEIGGAGFGEGFVLWYSQEADTHWTLDKLTNIDFGSLRLDISADK